MRIIKSSREDVIRRREEYNKRKAEYDDRLDEMHHSYESALEATLSPIKEYLTNELDKFDKLVFNVYTGLNFGDSVEVKVSCNEYRVHDDSSALSWNYRVLLNSSGELEQESSSWSGLRAVTSEQLYSLRQTVSALEFLNSVDWKKLMDVDVPQYSDYVKRNELDKPEYEDFDRQITIAAIEDCIGEDVLVLLQDAPSLGYNKVYVKVVGQTPAMFKVIPVPMYVIDSGRDIKDYIESFGDPLKIKKSSIRPVKSGDDVVKRAI